MHGCARCTNTPTTSLDSKPPIQQHKGSIDRDLELEERCVEARAERQQLQRGGRRRAGAPHELEQQLAQGQVAGKVACNPAALMGDGSGRERAKEADRALCLANRELRRCSWALRVGYASCGACLCL